MLSIPIIPQVFSDSQLLIATIKNRIYHSTPVTNIETKNNLAADMARDEEIDLSNIPTAEMFTDCVIQPEPKLPFLEQFTAMVIVRIGYGNGLENGLAIVISNGIKNAFRNAHGNDIGTGNSIGHAVRKHIIWACVFRGNPC
jgi:hypothetical protein